MARTFRSHQTTTPAPPSGAEDDRLPAAEDISVHPDPRSDDHARPHDHAGGFLRRNALALACLTLFLVFWVSQSVTGWHVFNEEAESHQQTVISYAEYLRSGHFLEATFENWESEFLQMFSFVLLTAWFIQRGSAESKQEGHDPVDDDPREHRGDPEAPWPVRKGGVWLTLYENSLLLAFVVLFFGSMVGHALGGLAEYSAEQQSHGEEAATLVDYVTSSQFWSSRSRTGRASSWPCSASWCSPSSSARSGRRSRSRCTCRTTAPADRRVAYPAAISARRPRRDGPFLRAVRFDGAVPARYPFDIPAVQQLPEVRFGPVTVFVGDNGTGKSTVVEGLAVAAGFNAEGGSRNLQFATHATHSDLHDRLVLQWHRRPRWGWFLRAETFYGMATHITEDDDPRAGVAALFPKLHEESHGESFLDLLVRRFTGPGLYLMDEPESALSFDGQLKLLRIIHDSVREGSQFLIATHSPVLMAFPGAELLELDDDGVHRVPYDDVRAVGLWRRFLAEPTSVLERLFADDEERDEPAATT